MAENVAGPSTAPGSVLLATGGYDNVINLWDVNTGVISGNLLHAESVSFNTNYVYSNYGIRF